MEMEIDDTPKPKGEETKGKPIVVILVGAPGSGKSTFCEQVMASSTRPWVRICQSSVSHKNTKEKEPSYKGHDNISSFSGNASKELKECENLAVCSSGSHASLNNTPTLAFPSISTSYFQFNLEKASDIIVEVVEEYVNKLGSARLVLVDVSHKSKILSLVKTKERENICSASASAKMRKRFGLSQKQIWYRRAVWYYSILVLAFTPSASRLNSSDSL